MRYLLYTNECVGLGHLRRALGLARALTQTEERATALIVTGSPLTPGLRLPERVDLVTLPLLSRDDDGNHHPRRLAVELDEVQRLRACLARAAAEAFQPDVAIVDKTPIGLRGELLSTLETLRTGSCRLVLGLRDVEDAPARVQQRWQQADVRRSVERYYDAVLVYGPPDGDDAASCLGWGSLLSIPVHHVGYIQPTMPNGGPPDLAPGYVLATVGGGADGFQLLSTFIAGIRARPLPCPTVVVTGPLMPVDRVECLRTAAAGLDLHLFDVRPDMDAVIAGAGTVLAMAGYNTVAELLAAGKRALLVPRVRPSQEQFVRASRLADSGAFAMLHPDDLSPSSLRLALDGVMGRETWPRRMQSEDGALVAATLLHELASAAEFEPPLLAQAAL